RSVLTDPYYKISREKLWFTQRFPHEADLEVNTSLVDPLLRSLKFKHEPDAFFQHLSATALLRDIYKDLLIEYQVRQADVPSWYGQLVTVGDILDENPNAKVLVLKMRADEKRDTRSRSVGKSGEIQIHQGASSKKNDPNKYGGDKDMFDQELVTVQLHRIDVVGGATGIPAIAVHIPEALRRDDVGVQVAPA
ncbi:MAG: hypothetical protein ABI625_21430, partial [bacterium]